MSETTVVQFPLPLPREVGGHVWLIELPGQPITIADKVTAFDFVNRYNAGPKVKELVVSLAQYPQLPMPDKDGVPYVGLPKAAFDYFQSKAREVSAALGGKAE